MMMRLRCLVLMALAAAGLVAACGDSGTDTPGGASRVTSSGGSTSTAGAQVGVGACEEGTIRDCSVDLGTFNGVRSCFVGQQLCRCSVWGPCVDSADLYEVGGTCGGGGAAGAAGRAAAGRSSGGGAAGVI